MTLIAAYRAYGTPVLTGDFLLTSSGASNSTEVDSLRKKVVRITKNLAIGWTDSFVVASSVLRDMREKIPANGLANKKWLEDIFTGYSEDDFKPLAARFVGWLIEDGEYCFSWNSEYPGTVFYEEPMIDGSGRDLYEDRFSRSNPFTIPLSREANLAMAIQYCLTTTCNMTSEEILHDGKFRPLGVGYAYESLYMGPDGFQYLDNVLYCVLSASFDENCISTDARTEVNFYKYLSYQEHSVIIIAGADDKGLTIDAKIISSPDYVDNGAKSRIFLDVGRLVEAGEHIVSDYYCCFIKMSCPNYRNLLMELTLPRSGRLDHQDGDSQIGINVYPTGYIFYVTSQFLNLLYKTLRQNPPIGKEQRYLSIGGMQIVDVTPHRRTE